jgi:hypothetical protein
MSQQIKHQRVTTRLPEPLCERIREQAEKQMCSASDIIRQSLLAFFSSECQTNTEQNRHASEVPV